MHPVVYFLPAVGLIFGPRLWVGHVLKKHNLTDENVSTAAGEFARELLDRHGLQLVRVESTDIGDHYDPQARVVRLGRDKFDRKTLTALTTASHEVAHAIQHATGYGPFVWRTRLVKVAQVTGDIGAVLLLAVPATALLGRNPLPPTVIGAAAMGMLGTSVVAQLAALPSELDASFARALPMLAESQIDPDRFKDAHSILLACSLTYVTSSLVAILHIWPWVGGPIIRRPVAPTAGVTAESGGVGHRDGVTLPLLPIGPKASVKMPARGREGTCETPFRRCAKSIIRGWLRLTGDY